MLDSTKIGIAGEFHALAQLAQRGLVASFTLANTKAVDVLVFDEGLDRVFKLEVKTTNQRPRNEKQFAPGPVYSWRMSAKHEKVENARLTYCFVALRGEGELPLFFIVPGGYVADYVRKQHEHWEGLGPRSAKPNLVRQFRIDEGDPLGFRDNWGLLSGESPREDQLKVPEGWFTRKA